MNKTISFPNSSEISKEAALLLIGNEERSWRDFQQTELAEATIYQAHGVNIMALHNYLAGVTQYFIQDINA
tara:strand:- start:368 stop:580 length:213 start_codon:yes stop_codon:yes gene_type:complete